VKRFQDNTEDEMKENIQIMNWEMVKLLA